MPITTDGVTRKIASRGSLSRNGTAGSVIVASPSKLTRPRIAASDCVVDWMLSVSAPAPPRMRVWPPTCWRLIVSLPPPPEIESFVGRSVVDCWPSVARPKPVSATVNVSAPPARRMSIDSMPWSSMPWNTVLPFWPVFVPIVMPRPMPWSSSEESKRATPLDES